MKIDDGTTIPLRQAFLVAFAQVVDQDALISTPDRDEFDRNMTRGIEKAASILGIPLYARAPDYASTLECLERWVTEAGYVFEIDENEDENELDTQEV